MQTNCSQCDQPLMLVHVTVSDHKLALSRGNDGVMPGFPHPDGGFLDEDGWHCCCTSSTQPYVACLTCQEVVGRWWEAATGEVSGDTFAAEVQELLTEVETPEALMLDDEDFVTPNWLVDQCCAWMATVEVIWTWSLADALAAWAVSQAGHADASDARQDWYDHACANEDGAVVLQVFTPREGEGIAVRHEAGLPDFAKLLGLAPA